MSGRIEYKKGQVLGDHGIEFVEDIPNDPKDFRRAKFKCHCGKIFETRITAITHSTTKSCGCIIGKNRRIEYKQGDAVGDHQIVYLKDLPNDKYNQRRALFKCRCGNEFEALISRIKDGDTKSCGCKNFIRICKECGNKFFGGPLSVFCENCRTKICENCGVGFIAHYKKGRGWEKCCSKKCADEQRKGNPVYGHNRITNYTTIFCKHCGRSMFIRDLKSKRERKFCSRRCQGAYYSKLGSLRRFDKDIDWRWNQMQTSKYKKWHRDILERDNYLCRECFDLKGIINGDNLIVHHIIPVYIDPTKIVDINNGITLCKKCHDKIYGKEPDYCDYYFKLLNLTPPINSRMLKQKQLYKSINIPQALRKIKLGYTYEHIAKQFSVCEQTLCTKLKGSSMPQHRLYKPVNGTFYTILKLATGGQNIVSIAKELKTTTNKISIILQQIWGVHIRQQAHKKIGLTGNILRRTAHIPKKRLAEIFNVSRTTIGRLQVKYEVI